MATLLNMGSRGDAVKQLQQALNRKGYALDVDGIYGQKTMDAVRSYQSSNGLAADGIAGEATQTHLYGENAPPTAAQRLQQLEENVPTYQKSETLQKAEEDLKNYSRQKPGEYQSAYQAELDALLQDIVNGPAFSYDPYSDAAYRQYRQQYTELGRRAMEDTVATAAGQTGGYASSYAATAGEQAYRQYLTQLNDLIPELMQQALRGYEAQGAQKQQQLAALQGAQKQEYNAYRDAVQRYYDDYDRAYRAAEDLAGQEYDQFLSALQQWQKDRTYYAQQAAAEQKTAAGSGGKGSANGTGTLEVVADSNPDSPLSPLVLLTLLGETVKDNPKSIIKNRVTGLKMQTQ